MIHLMALRSIHKNWLNVRMCTCRMFLKIFYTFHRLNMLRLNLVDRISLVSGLGGGMTLAKLSLKHRETFLAQNDDHQLHPT